MVKELSESLPSIEQLLQSIQSSLQSRRSAGGGGSPDLLPGLALFGAGLLVGAGLALLFAPATGEEMREQIGERLHEVRERINGGTAHDSAS